MNRSWDPILPLDVGGTFGEPKPRLPATPRAQMARIHPTRFGACRPLGSNPGSAIAPDAGETRWVALDEDDLLRPQEASLHRNEA